MSEATRKRLLVGWNIDEETAEELEKEGITLPHQIKVLSEKELAKIVGKDKAAKVKAKFEAHPAK